MSNIQLYNGDCLEVMDDLIQQGIKVDLFIIDPPYFRILKEDWDKFKNIEEYLKWSKIYLEKCINLLRLSGTLCIYGCSRNINVLSRLNSIIEDNCCEFIQEIIINKGIKSIAGRTSKKIKMLPPVSENIMIFRKNAKPYIKQLLKDKQNEYGFTSKEISNKLGFALNGGGNWTKYAGNTEFPLLPTKEHWEKIKKIFNININYKEIEEVYNPKIGLTNVWSDINFNIKRCHPAEKPIELEKRIIELFSNTNNLICSPFLGSGNAAIACKNLNRNFIGIELDENYYNIAKERINES